MISILMPIYNGIEFIEESVSSVLKQTDDRWELLIGINGHPENSEVYKIAKSYELISDKIRVFDFYEIRGKSAALNEMVKYALYDYVAILDVDDVWGPLKLEKQIPFVLDGYDVIGSRCVYFGKESHRGIMPRIPTGDISETNFFLDNPIINSSVIIRKKYAYWSNHENTGVEDYDLWLELRSKHCRFYNCSQALVKHRIHDSSAFNANGNSNHVSALLEKHLRNCWTMDSTNVNYSISNI